MQLGDKFSEEDGLVLESQRRAIVLQNGPCLWHQPLVLLQLRREAVMYRVLEFLELLRYNLSLKDFRGSQLLPEQVLGLLITRPERILRAKDTDQLVSIRC